jgi:hypothetical protein
LSFLRKNLKKELNEDNKNFDVFLQEEIFKLNKEKFKFLNFLLNFFEK